MINSKLFSLLSYDEQDKYLRNFSDQKCSTNVDFDEFMSMKSPNFSAFLKRSFVFDLTLEGYDYWMAIANSNRCFEEWVTIGYVDLNTNEKRKLYMPMSFANEIADQMIMNNIFTSYTIERGKKNEV